jgi:hypothetical protein
MLQTMSNESEFERKMVDLNLNAELVVRIHNTYRDAADIGPAGYPAW